MMVTLLLLMGVQQLAQLKPKDIVMQQRKVVLDVEIQIDKQ